jgi:hypothetical protein
MIVSERGSQEGKGAQGRDIDNRTVIEYIDVRWVNTLIYYTCH